MRFTLARRVARSLGACAVLAALVAGTAGNLVDVPGASATVVGVVLSPTSGPAGTSVTATTDGYSPGEMIDVSYNGVGEGSCTADMFGDCSVPFDVPPLEANSYNVVAVGQTSGDTHQSQFTETASLSLTPNSGPWFDPVALAATGFAPSEEVDITFGGTYEDACVAGATGSCSLSDFVPPALDNGTYTVEAQGESSHIDATAPFTLASPTIDSLSPAAASGPVGTVVTVGVVDWPAEADFYWGMVGSTDGDLVTSCLTSGPENSCTATFTVPPTPGGDELIHADPPGDPDGAEESYADFDVTSQITPTPDSGLAGSAFDAAATGFGAGDTVDVSFAGTPVGSCTADDNGGCTASATVPALASPGSATVSANGTSGLTAGASFTVLPTPALVLTASSGAQGSMFNATASNFVPGESVKLLFDNNDTGKSCTAVAGTCTIDDVTVPKEAHGSYEVEALGATGDSAESSLFTIAPSIVVDPSTGPPGTSPSVSATGFAAGEEVFFSIGGTTYGSCTADSTGDCNGNVFVQGYTPAGPVGVSAQGQTSLLTAGADYTVALLSGPSKIDITPASGLEGSTFDASLSNFYPGLPVELYFNGSDTGRSCTPDSTDGCTIPGVAVPGEYAGSYGVVAQQGSTSADASTNFDVEPTLQLSSDAGAAGDTISVQGSNFSPNESVDFTFSDSFTVYDLGPLCTADGNGDCNATLTVPALALAGGDTVTALGGASHVPAHATFTVTGPTTGPVVSAVSPDAGRTTGGTVVTISGSGFAAPARVRFGPLRATRVTVVNADTITATSPPGLGTVNVRVTEGGGASAVVPADTFMYLARPIVRSVVPGAGPPAGGTPVTIRGIAFVDVSAVTFGGVAATDVTVVNSTTITATAPPGHGTVDVRVTTPVWTSAATGADRFAYPAAPRVTKVSPSSGPAAGGSVVTVTGSRLLRGATVSFGSSVAPSVTFANPSLLVVVVPPGSGTVEVTVTTPGGTSAVVAGDRFTYS